MSERVRLLVMVVFWCAWAGIGVAVTRLWGHESWGRVILIPVLVVAVGSYVEVKRRRLKKRSTPPPLM